MRVSGWTLRGRIWEAGTCPSTLCVAPSQMSWFGHSIEVPNLSIPLSMTAAVGGKEGLLLEQRLAVHWIGSNWMQMRRCDCKPAVGSWCM